MARLIKLIQEMRCYILPAAISYERVIKILHMSMLLDIFPYLDFSPDTREEEHNNSLQSSY